MVCNDADKNKKTDGKEGQNDGCVRKISRDDAVVKLAEDEFERLDDHGMFMVLVEGCSGVENFDDETLVNEWFLQFGEEIEIL